MKTRTNGKIKKNGMTVADKPVATGKSAAAGKTAATDKKLLQGKDMMFESAKRICDEYADARAHLAQYKADAEFYGECASKANTDFERFFIENKFRNSSAQVKKAESAIAMYQATTMGLKKKQKSVLEQIYGEQARWKDVVDDMGYPMSSGTISFVLKKAFAEIEREIETAKEQYDSGAKAQYDSEAKAEQH